MNSVKADSTRDGYANNKLCQELTYCRLYLHVSLFGVGLERVKPFTKLMVRVQKEELEQEANQVVSEEVTKVAVLVLTSLWLKYKRPGNDKAICFSFFSILAAAVLALCWPTWSAQYGWLDQLIPAQSSRFPASRQSEMKIGLTGWSSGWTDDEDDEQNVCVCARMTRCLSFYILPIPLFVVTHGGSFSQADRPCPS